ncbi:tRNA pseudouridine(38-40) synthase TruA [Swingsia samuiensis]|uniref:tRNA pseudouridine synthase A n=1 Tax=Swingsia samuiensis TaxID=1293412 RepID=A0A4Y6UIT8_9PROT|nr:tRNA pseudouridine(38-40) synthase TruA [Swingsia samuiensis]QDH17539.1 tRNA pseudouridine(38-40) synthase TruA [Swingsia samuiensis]
MTDDNIIRWAIRIEFDGTEYVGWQRQNNGISVQELIEKAASQLIGGRPVSSITAGRTDAGVHAAGLVVHLDFPADVVLNKRQIRDGMGFYLKPHPVVILDAAPVSLDWSARFSAIWRSYRFTILNRPSRPALHTNRVWHVKRPLNAAAMHEGAQYLLGCHDFSSFRAAACQANSPLRTLDVLNVHRENEFIFIETKARSFLHHQVRNMVGSLALVGTGKWEPRKMKCVLNAKNRAAAGPTSPPEGLCFMDVGYLDDPFLAN